MKDLESSYREMPPQGSLEIPCSPGDVVRLLEAAERAGFHGLRVENGGIKAWKGKAGPCHDTGRTASYRGSAAAALDDDRHLLFGTIRVCEKTARLYASAAYAPWTNVSEGDAALLGRLDTDPVPFDCDTFERDAAALASTLTGRALSGRPVSVFYPGPFKLLILADGTMIRRGHWARIAEEAGRDLAAKDGARMGDAGGEPPESYVTRYKARGAACLLGELGNPHGETRPPDLGVLADASDEMRRRLLAMISRGDPYFILTGSDPSQKDGCCPSSEVGEANALVRAGVLEALDGPGNASCPVTVYAFRGEVIQEKCPEFKPKGPLRESVAERIRRGRELTPKIALRAALVILAGLSLVALAYGLYRHFQGAGP
jgi:hypothetical protein